MQQILCFESEFIVPGAIFMDGKLHHPFRIYSNIDGTLCIDMRSSDNDRWNAFSIRGSR
jgi:predicted ATP-grasp superfamily ATP-dependent carboligase